jgi:hypothetical protein
MHTVMTREFDHEESAALAKQLQALFNHWQLSPAQQLAVLGLGGSADAVQADIDWSIYLAGEGGMRAGQLLAIHASLRSLFPANPELAYSWMQTPNKAFNGATPLSLIDHSGMAGLLAIRTYLQRALGR